MPSRANRAGSCCTRLLTSYEGDDEAEQLAKIIMTPPFADAGFMKLLSQGAGRLINMLVVESPLRLGRGGRFRNAQHIRILQSKCLWNISWMPPR